MEKRLSLYQSHPWFFAIDCISTFDETTAEWSRYPNPYIVPEGIPGWLKKRWHLWEYNAKVFDKILEPKDKYWPKSQRMMITIDFCVAYLWGFLFEDGFNGFMTSKVQEAIDNIKAGWNSLFGKIRAMYDRLPGVVVEATLGKLYHSSEIFNYMAATNPKNGNVIVGHAPTPACGIGEGYTIALVDECAAVYNMNIIHTNLTQSCRDNKNYVSFPLGRNNKFAQIHDHKRHFGFEKVEINWSMNPRYTQEWYGKQKEKLTSFELAQRVDISFEESTRGKVWDKFNYSEIVKPTEHIRGLPVYLIWDFGFHDFTDVGFVQYVRPKLRIFDWYEVNHSNYREVSEDLRAMLNKYGFKFRMIGKDSEGFDKYRLEDAAIQSYGDPQVKTTEVRTGLNMQISYEEQGFPIETCDFHNTVMVLDRINSAFEKRNIEIDPKADPIINSARYWEWPVDTQGNPKPGATQPRHDKYSHAGKALEYGFTMICMRDVGQSMELIESVYTSKNVDMGVDTFAEEF